jgi:hypothetical protein
MQGLHAVALVLLTGLLLTACLDDQTSATGDGEPGAPVIERADSAEPAAVTQDAAAGGAADETKTAGAEQDSVPEQPGYEALSLDGLTNKPLPNGEIKGSWVGLFGGTDVGVIQHAWEEGHRIDFMPDGQAIWSRMVNGVVLKSMDSQWAQDYDRLMLSFPADVAVQTGLAELAPLGLEPGGVAREPGSTPLSDDTFNPMQSSLQITLYPSYLVLTDSYGKMMVYGKLPDSDPAVGAQGLAGNWTASLNAQPDGTVIVGFADGNMVLDGWNRGGFSGTYIQGYFVGRLRQDGTTNYAVASFNEHTSGNIHGIICEGPYYTTHQPFEFIR